MEIILCGPGNVSSKNLRTVWIYWYRCARSECLVFNQQCSVLRAQQHPQLRGGAELAVGRKRVGKFLESSFNFFSQLL